MQNFVVVMLLVSLLISGRVHMKASQAVSRAKALCRDLTSSLIPIQNLISFHMSRRAGPLGEISLVYWRDLCRWDENQPI